MIENTDNTPQLINQPNSNLNNANDQSSVSEPVNNNNETQPILCVNKRTQTQDNESGEDEFGM